MGILNREIGEIGKSGNRVSRDSRRARRPRRDHRVGRRQTRRRTAAGSRSIASRSAAHPIPRFPDVAAAARPLYRNVRTRPLLLIRRSEVMSVRSCTRAVAAIRRSAGSGGNVSPESSESIATSTVSGRTSSCGEDAAVRSHSGHGPKSSSTTTRPRARCQAASFSEMAAMPIVQHVLHGASRNHSAGGTRSAPRCRRGPPRCPPGSPAGRPGRGRSSR